MTDLQCAKCQAAITRKLSKSQNGKCASCYEMYSNITRKSSYIRKYGIDLEDYNRMFSEQRGVCGACGRPETKINPKTKRIAFLCVDHNHATGRVRGLLCHTCNSALGLLQDDPRRIAGLLNYAVTQEEEDKKNMPMVKKRGPGRKAGITIDYSKARENLQKYLGKPIPKPFELKLKR